MFLKSNSRYRETIMYNNYNNHNTISSSKYLFIFIEDLKKYYNNHIITIV